MRGICDPSRRRTSQLRSPRARPLVVTSESTFLAEGPMRTLDHEYRSGQPLLCDKCNPPTLMKETDIKGIYVCDSGHAKDQRPKKPVPLLPGPLGGARRRRKP